MVATTIAVLSSISSLFSNKRIILPCGAEAYIYSITKIKSHATPDTKDLKNDIGVEREERSNDIKLIAVAKKKFSTTSAP